MSGSFENDPRLNISVFSGILNDATKQKLLKSIQNSIDHGDYSESFTADDVSLVSSFLNTPENT